MAPTLLVSGDIQAKILGKRLTTMTPYANHFQEIFAKHILNCARYLGSKLPLNNRPRAWRTFSCIDPTARGNEWTVRHVKEKDTRSCCHGRTGGGQE